MSAMVVKTGYLCKRPTSGRQGSSHRRFIALLADRIQWFKDDKTDGGPLNEMLLEQDTLLSMLKDGRLSVKSGARELVLSEAGGGSANSLLEWHSAISRQLEVIRAAAAQTTADAIFSQLGPATPVKMDARAGRQVPPPAPLPPPRADETRAPAPAVQTSTRLKLPPPVQVQTSSRSSNSTAAATPSPHSSQPPGRTRASSIVSYYEKQATQHTHHQVASAAAASSTPPDDRVGARSTGLRSALRNPRSALRMPRTPVNRVVGRAHRVRATSVARFSLPDTLGAQQLDPLSPQPQPSSAGSSNGGGPSSDSAWPPGSARSPNGWQGLTGHCDDRFDLVIVSDVPDGKMFSGLSNEQILERLRSDNWDEHFRIDGEPVPKGSGLRPGAHGGDKYHRSEAILFCGLWVERQARRLGLQVEVRLSRDGDEIIRLIAIDAHMIAKVLEACPELEERLPSNRDADKVNSRQFYFSSLGGDSQSYGVLGEDGVNAQQQQQQQQQREYSSLERLQILLHILTADPEYRAPKKKERTLSDATLIAQLELYREQQEGANEEEGAFKGAGLRLQEYEERDLLRIIPVHDECAPRYCSSNSATPTGLAGWGLSAGLVGSARRSAVWSTGCPSAFRTCCQRRALARRRRRRR